MNSAKKALVISAVFPPEPVVSANISFEIANQLSIDFCTTVISPRPSRPAGYNYTGQPLKFSFKQIQVDSFVCAKSNILGRLIESYSFGKKCADHIADNTYDVIYMNSWPLAAQFLAVKEARKKNIPIISHIQDIYPESLINKIPLFKKFLTKLLLPIDKYIIENSSRVITISEKMKEYLLQTRDILSNKIDVVYNWQDAKRYPIIEKGHHKSSFVFLFLGSLSPSASIDTIIKAFIQANIHSSKLIIAGNGSEKIRLRSLLNESKLNIEFIDAPSEDVGKIQSNANVLILSLKKGVGKLALPSKLSAYMFSGKPIIGSIDIDSDAAHIISKADCGWVVEPESIDKLCDLMIKVSGIEENILVMRGKNGHLFANEYFSKEKNLEKLTSIIKSFI